jgi:hypothetical protein
MDSKMLRAPNRNLNGYAKRRTQDEYRMVLRDGKVVAHGVVTNERVSTSFLSGQPGKNVTWASAPNTPKL